MPLARFDAPFEHPDWIFEPKLDGFRAVAYVEGGACRPVLQRLVVDLLDATPLLLIESDF
jgi:hypothetical protein